MAARRRKIPVPEGMDPREASVIPVLVRPFVDSLGDDLIIEDAATDFITMCDRDYPDALGAWTSIAVLDQVTHLLRSEFAKVRLQVKRAATLDDAKSRARAAHGVGESRSSTLDGNGRYKKLLSMTKSDCLRIADRHQAVGRGHLLEAAKHRLLASRLPADDSLVGDFWSEDEIVDMQSDLGGQDVEDLEGM